jgi:hypothetical protein
MALRPAFTCWTAWLPVRAPRELTKSSVWSFSHSCSAPRRARVISSCTDPRRRTTSSAVYSRVMFAQRGSASHSWRISSAVLGALG